MLQRVTAIIGIQREGVSGSGDIIKGLQEYTAHNGFVAK